jgi:hypothetical protein
MAIAVKTPTISTANGGTDGQPDLIPAREPTDAMRIQTTKLPQD